MRRFNKNCLLFASVMIFILLGLPFDTVWKTITESADNLRARTYEMEDVRNRMEEVTGEKLNYHTMLMDVNSAKENLEGTRIITKDDTVVVKSASGSLGQEIEPVDEAVIAEAAGRIAQLQAVAEENGAGFLYCAAPRKEQFLTFPCNAVNCAESNQNAFLTALRNAGIPTLDFTGVIQDCESSFETFYQTDHHWTSRTGFAACNAVVNALNARYGFTYDSSLTDLTNYTVTRYPDWFLGSTGKKVGLDFTWSGADDFDLITPDFETNFTEERPMADHTRTGRFEDTVLYMENMKKDYYKINTYATYSGGDFRLQIIKNNLNPEGAKVLLIRDSYACVVAPFLALQTGELHVCDVRNYLFFVGDKLNMEAYIKEIKPDYVLVLYTGVETNENGRYDFF